MSEKITDRTDLGYVHYTGQETHLRKYIMRFEKPETVAMMSSDDICEWCRKKGLVPMVITFCDGTSDLESVYLVKEEFLHSDSVELISR